MQLTDCSTCSLAFTATWQDFKNMVLRQYLLFRAAGGEAFIGFSIPHTSKFADGHLHPSCPGEYSILLSFDDGENCLTIYRSDEQVTCTYIPWDAALERMELDDFPSDCDQNWVGKEEWVAVNIAGDLAVSELSKHGVDPVDAFFTSHDWVMRYE
jgi:hypothetical protein